MAEHSQPRDQRLSFPSRSFRLWILLAFSILAVLSVVSVMLIIRDVREASVRSGLLVSIHDVQRTTRSLIAWAHVYDHNEVAREKLEFSKNKVLDEARLAHSQLRDIEGKLASSADARELEATHAAARECVQSILSKGVVHAAGQGSWFRQVEEESNELYAQLDRLERQVLNAQKVALQSIAHRAIASLLIFLAIGAIVMLCVVDPTVRWAGRLVESTDLARREAERLAMIAEKSATVMITTNPQGEVEWVNKAFTDLTGYTLEEVQGKKPGRVLQSPETDPFTVEQMREAIRENRLFRGEILNRTKFGRLYWLDLEIQPLFDSANKHVGYIAVQMDITERKESETRHRESEEIWKFAIEGAGDGVWDWNPQTGEMKFSDRWKEMLGYAPEEVSDSLEFLENSIHTGDLPVVSEKLNAYLNEASEHYMVEFRMRRKDGQYTWILSRGMIVRRDSQGQPVRMVGTHSDISVQKALLEQLEREAVAYESAIQELREAQAVGRLGNWSYDICTGAITWSAQLFRLFGRDEAEGPPDFEQVLAYYTPESKARLVAAVENTIATGLPYSLVLETRVAAQDVRFIRGEGRATLNEDGEPIRLSGTATDITEQVEREREVIAQAEELMRVTEDLDRMANWDPLTSLVNRRQFLRICGQVLESNQEPSRSAVFFIDLDNFKYVNDTLGHDAGDMLLKTIADQLKENLSEKAVPARLGGDEFAILIPGLDDPDIAESIGSKLIQAMSVPVEVVPGNRLTTTFSIGIAISEPGQTVDDVVKAADLAMYSAKFAGKSRAMLYEPWMAEAARERMSLESDLRQAMGEQRLEMHYQPLVDLSTGEVVKVEALMRWQHAELGSVPPDQFISLAEEVGLVVPLGEWALMEACCTVQRWHEQHGLRHIDVAVNISAKQLRDKGFGQAVQNALSASGLEPSQLILEITETAVMTDLDNMISCLSELRKLGIKVAMDDFGTGYSSLGALRRLPIDILKIDKTFVNDIGSDIAPTAILRAITSLCHLLDLVVVAEGIETQEELVQLFGLGCDLGQGYLFCKPLPESEVLTRLTQGPISLAA